MKKNKYYIMATPCSGKTTFIKKHSFDDIILYDMDDFEQPKTYTIFKNIKEDKSKIHIVFGRPHNPNFKICNYLSVKIPLNTLERNIRERAEKSPNNLWTSLRKIKPIRNSLIKISKQNNIKIFESFDDVIKYIKNKK